MDISPLMLERAEANVRAAHLDGRITVPPGDICALPFGDNSFDIVIAEAVTVFADRPRAARELARVCAPGGQVLATEFCWRTPPPEQARQVFLGQVCPGMVFDTVDDWVQLYSSAGLVGVETQAGPFEMMTPRGLLADEGPAHSLTIMTRVASRPANIRKMAWLMPRMAKAVPYLGYVLVASEKPR